MNEHDIAEVSFNNGYEKGFADAKPKWIPVTERLPTEEDALFDRSVCAYTKEHKVIVLYWQYVCRFHHLILYWMPMHLPEPPKGEM